MHEVEITYENERCPKCRHSPLNLQDISTVEGIRCMDCEEQIPLGVLPPDLHGNWVIVAR